VVGASVTRTQRREWLDATDPWRVSELDPGELGASGVPDGLRGLVDRLTGRSLALVCAGGGARSLTQIGVLLELEEAGVRVDRYAGTSMGAIIAGLAATGSTAAEVGDVIYREFVRQDMFGDYGIPRTSLLRGRRAWRSSARSYGDWTIEELPRGFRCVSTDLVSRTPVVHRSGLLVDAVRASARIPVVFTPIVSGARLLVDGGVFDNLPVDTVTERAEGPIVAVNVSAGSGRPPGQPPRPPRVPPLGETMMRTFMISGGDGAGAQRQGAWVITPHSMGAGFLEYHQYDALVASGRSAARTLLEHTGGDLVGSSGQTA
jgi:predicted acylesterase/phospholipase RssA